MASEWAVAKFADAPLDIIDGDRGSNYPKQGDFSATGYCLFLNAGNVTVNGFDFSNCAFVSDEKDSALRKGRLQRNDVVLTTRGTVGNVAYYDDSVAYDHVRINSGMVILRARPQELRPRYLYLFLRSSLFQAQVESLRTGSAQPQLPIRDINQIEIPIPSPDEQDAIVHILGTLDDKIELNRRMNETLEGITRALFKSWFVDFEPVRAKIEGRDSGLPKMLADFFPTSLENSEIGEVPRGWSIGNFGDVADNPRRTVSPDEIKPTTPYIALEHMPRKSIALSDWGNADGVESGKFVFHAGEILFGKLRPYFHKVGVAPVDGVCSTDILVVTPRSGDWFGFVLGHASSAAFVEHTNAGSTGTKMPRTNWSDMARYQVVLPPEPLARAYTEQVRPLISRIEASIHQNRSLAALRDALLPKLISGELQLPNAKRNVGGLA